MKKMPGSLDDLLRGVVKEETGRRNPKLAAKQSSLGEQALREERFEKARDHFQVAFNNDPKIEYLFRKGGAVLQGVRPKERVKDYEQAAALYDRAALAVKCLDYRVKDIIDFFADITKESFWANREDPGTLGILLAALINQAIKPDETIRLKLSNGIEFVGAFHERGTLIVEGKWDFDKDNYYYSFLKAGYGMRGGKVIMKSFVGPGYGDHMEGGELVLEGKVTCGGLSSFKGGRAVIKSFTSTEEAYWGSNTGIGTAQSGGVIEIFYDIPYVFNMHLSKDQTGGELIAHRSVAVNHIGSGKKGGTTIIGSASGDSGQEIGHEMEGGDIIIENDVGNPNNNCSLVGLHQKGGYIWIKGNAYCNSLGMDAWPRSRVRVGKNLFGELGGNSTAGLSAIVDGDVYGNVAGMAWDMNCIVKGNVYGDVAHVFGRDCSNDRDRDSKLEIFGDVNGNVATMMYPRCEVVVHGNVTGKVGELYGGVVRVGGSIGEVLPVISGEVYQKGRNITRKSISASLLRTVIGPLLGEK